MDLGERVVHTHLTHSVVNSLTYFLQFTHGDVCDLSLQILTCMLPSLGMLSFNSQKLSFFFSFFAKAARVLTYYGPGWPPTQEPPALPS